MPKQSKAEDILANIDIVAPVFFRFYSEGRRNADFYLGQQWTIEEVNLMRRQGREPYVWNKIYSYINNVLGMQIQTRTDYSILPVEPADAKVTGILLTLLKWAESINNLDTIETDVFLHGLLYGFSCTQIRWDLSDFWGGYPKIERIPSTQIMWDATDSQTDLASARWMARIIPMMAEDIDENFSAAQAKKIKSMQRATIYRKLPFYSFLTQNQEMIYYMSGSMGHKPDLLPWFIIEYYEKKRKPVYTVVDLLYGNGMQFSDEKKAEEYLAGLLSEYSQIPDAELIDENGVDLVYISEGYQNVITQTILCGETIITEQETDLTEFPFQFYFPSNVDGVVYSPVSVLVPPQKFLNKLLAEWDNILGRTGRGVLTVIESLLPRGWSAERIAKLRSQTAPVIPILRDGAIQSLPDHTTTPDIPNLINIVSSFMMEAGGGPNILGLQENAAESGKSVRARQAAAGMSRVPFFHGLQQWKRQVCLYLLWIMQNNLTQQQIKRIVGMDKNINPEELTDGQFDTVRSLRVDIDLSVAVDTDTARQELYNQILQFIGSGGASGLSPQTLLYLLLEFNPAITQDVKDKVYEMEPLIKQAMEQIAQKQREQKVQQQAEDGAKRAMLRKEIMEQQQAQESNVQQ